MDEKTMKLLRSTLQNEEAVYRLILLPEFKAEPFLYFYNVYIDRDPKAAKMKREELLNNFIDLYVLFPYGEGLRDWLESDIPNEELIVYASHNLPVGIASLQSSMSDGMDKIQLHDTVAQIASELEEKDRLTEAVEMEREDPTQTPAFKAWFGKSKMVDKHGKPLVFYHGSGVESIKQFDPNRAGSIKQSDWGKGIYFTLSKYSADYYRETAVADQDEETNRLYAEYEAEAKRLGTTGMMSWIDLAQKGRQADYDHLVQYEKRWLDSAKKAEQSGKGKVYAVYLKIENPLIYQYEGMTDPTLPDQARAHGQDGVIITNELPRGAHLSEYIDEVVVFDSKQIKSVDAVEFNPHSDDIYEADSADPTQTPEFKAWFKGSKIKDEHGKPRVMYHGSGTNIDIFQYKFTNKGADALGSGFYFTSDETQAAGYAKQRKDSDTPKLGGEDNPTVHSVYLAITKPLDSKKKGNLNYDIVAFLLKKSPVLDDALSNFGDVEYSGKQKVFNEAVQSYMIQNGNILDQLNMIANDFYPSSEHIRVFNSAVRQSTLGYDGVIADMGNGITHVVAWFPWQIKATDATNFNPDSENIHEALEVEDTVDHDKIKDISGLYTLQQQHQEVLDCFFNMIPQ
jgi:hypothetical protein